MTKLEAPRVPAEVHAVALPLGILAEVELIGQRYQWKLSRPVWRGDWCDMVTVSVGTERTLGDSWAAMRDTLAAISAGAVAYRVRNTDDNLTRGLVVSLPDHRESALESYARAHELDTAALWLDRVTI